MNTGRVARLHELVGALERDSHRLFGDDMLSGTRSEHSLRWVQPRRRADRNSIAFDFRQHLFVRRIPRNAERLRESARTILIVIGRANELETIYSLDRVSVVACDASASDERDAE